MVRQFLSVAVRSFFESRVPSRSTKVICWIGLFVSYRNWAPLLDRRLCKFDNLPNRTEYFTARIVVDTSHSVLTCDHIGYSFHYCYGIVWAITAHTWFKMYNMNKLKPKTPKRSTTKAPIEEPEAEPVISHGQNLYVRRRFASNHPNILL